MPELPPPPRPRCACCGKPLPYSTRQVRAPRIPNTIRPVPGWRYDGNQLVVSRRYVQVFIHDSGKEELWDAGWESETAYNYRPPERRQGRKERRLSEVNVWDGEHYSIPLFPFCSGPCVRRFAQASWRAGYRMRKEAA